VSAYFATLGHAHLDRSAYVEAMRGFALCGFSLETLNDAVARYKLKEGTAALVDAIRVDARIDPLLGDPVSSVTQDGSQAIVETEGGNRFHARCVIVTVPLNVLGSVSFTPALNEAKRMHSAERHAGVGVKGYATLRQNVGMVQCFAPDPAPITNAFTERNGPDGSVLVFFGPNRELLDSTNPASVQSALRAFMPGVEVTDLVSHDWVTSLLARHMVHLPPGTDDAVLPCQSRSGRPALFRKLRYRDGVARVHRWRDRTRLARGRGS
jgi:hypothetical protein